MRFPRPWRGSRPEGRIVTLIKPHYELEDAEKAEHLEARVLDEKEAASVLDRVLASFGDLKAEVLDVTASPIGGAKSARRSGGPGNREYLIRCAARRLRPPANRLPLHRFAARHGLAVSNVVLKLRRQALALLKDWTVLQVIMKVWLG